MLTECVAALCRACVRAHKLALMAQRQFWTSLLRDSVAFVDLLVGACSLIPYS
jgi:hypothetical protein